MPSTLSPSSLRIFKECPRCFWLQIVKGIKRPAGIFPSLPSGMDGLLKKHFDKCREEDCLPRELAEIGHCRLYCGPELPAWRSQFKGIRFTDENGHTLMGAVDEMLEEEGKLVVLDYKTRGYPIKEDTAGYYADQLALYTFLLHKNGYPVTGHAYLLIYHPTLITGNGDVKFHADLVKVAVSLAEAEDLFKRACECIDGDCPECADGCQYCGWQNVVV